MTLFRLRWLILGLLFLSTVINYIDRQALSVLLEIGFYGWIPYLTVDFGKMLGGGGVGVVRPREGRSIRLAEAVSLPRSLP